MGVDLGYVNESPHVVRPPDIELLSDADHGLDGEALGARRREEKGTSALREEPAKGELDGTHHSYGSARRREQKKEQKRVSKSTMIWLQRRQTDLAS